MFACDGVFVPVVLKGTIYTEVLAYVTSMTLLSIILNVLL